MLPRFQRVSAGNSPNRRRKATANGPGPERADWAEVSLTRAQSGAAATSSKTHRLMPAAAASPAKPMGWRRRSVYSTDRKRASRREHGSTARVAVHRVTGPREDIRHPELDGFACPLINQQHAAPEVSVNQRWTNWMKIERKSSPLLSKDQQCN